MTTANLVLYKTPRSQVEALLSSILPSCVEKFIIVDNLLDDRWRELESRSEKIRYFNKWGWFFDRERKEWNKKILEEIGELPKSI